LDSIPRTSWERQRSQELCPGSGVQSAKNVAGVKLRRGKIFRNNAKLFFSAGWVVGYIIAHASRRRLSPTGFRTVANGSKWPRSQGARAAAISKLKEILL
jgi:hypothetical protein